MWKKTFMQTLFPIDEDYVKLPIALKRDHDITKPNDADIELAMQLKHKNIPKSLFKYRAFDNTGYSLANFQNDELWLSLPQDFNDPFDSRKHSDWSDFVEAHMYFIDVYERHCINHNIKHDNVDVNDGDGELPLHRIIYVSMFNHELNSLVREFYEIKQKGLRPEEEIQEAYNSLFDALDECWDKTSWENHKYVIQSMYEAIPFKEALADSNRVLYKVGCLCEINDSVLMWSHYANSHTGFCIEYNLAQLPYSDFIIQKLYPVIYEDTTDNTEDWLKGRKFFNLFSILRKNVQWEYEKEWRIVVPKDCNMDTVRLPKAEAIYLGCNASDNNKLTLIEMAKLKRTKVYQMKRKGNQKLICDHIL